MKRYIIFVIDTGTHTAVSAEIQAVDIFNEYLENHGHWIAAGGLAAPTSSNVIDNRNGADLETHSPLYSEVEYFSGFWLINAQDAEEARKLAFEGSKACNRKVELRPLL